MKRFWKGLRFCSLAGGLFLLSGTVHAQDVQVRRASAIIGSTVQLSQGGAFGKVEDIVFNEDGCVEYLVVGHEQQYIALPYTVTQVNIQQHVVVVNAPRETVVQLTVPRDQLPTFSDRTFYQRVQTVYGDRLRGGADINRSNRGERANPGNTPRRPEANRPENSDRDPAGAPRRPAARSNEREEARPEKGDRPNPSRRPEGGDRPDARNRPEGGNRPDAARRPEGGDRPNADRPSSRNERPDGNNRPDAKNADRERNNGAERPEAGAPGNGRQRPSGSGRPEGANPNEERPENSAPGTRRSGQ